MKTLTFPILLIAILFSSCTNSGTEFHVSPSGTDSNPGTEAEPFQTISAAAEMAQAGDIITVHEGIYRESINPTPEKL